VVAEAECELGVLMREDPEELLYGDPYERARWLARRWPTGSGYGGKSPLGGN
jgi:streptomycin 6-kinase